MSTQHRFTAPLAPRRCRWHRHCLPPRRHSPRRQSRRPAAAGTPASAARIRSYGLPKILRSDNGVYADVYDPHPELAVPPEGVYATKGGGAPLQAQTPTGERVEAAGLGRDAAAAPPRRGRHILHFALAGSQYFLEAS